MGTTLLEVKHLSKEYRLKDGNSLKAVRDVSFSVEEGECIAVVGESGCGKSTLAKLITRIEFPSSGNILFGIDDIGNMKGKVLREKRKMIQMVFQQPSSAISPRMRIGQFLRVPLENFHIVPKKDIGAEVDRLLDLVQLDRSYKNKFPHEVSGGELQRVVIARAMAANPKMIICDEATSALDVVIQKDILALIRNLQEQNHISILFITHDLGIVKQISQRVMVMYKGRIMESLPSQSLEKEHIHPYTSFLMGSVFSIYEEQTSRKEILADIEFQKEDQEKEECCVFASRCPHSEEICKNKLPVLQPYQKDLGHLVACHLFS